MTTMSPATLPIAYTAVLAMATWDELRQLHLPPWPQRYVGAGVAFGLLGILETFAPDLAAVLGIGLMLGLAYKMAGTYGGGAAVTNSLDQPDAGAPVPARPGTTNV